MAIELIETAAGYSLNVPANLTVELPVKLLFTAETKAGQNLQNTITVGENSSVTVVEHYSSKYDNAYTTDVFTKIELAKSATLVHYKLQEENRKAQHISKLEVKQAANSNLNSQQFAMGSKVAENDISVDLAGEHANANLTGLYLVTDKQQIGFNTVVTHSKPECSSSEHYRGIIDAKGHGKFYGRIVVPTHAQKTAAQLDNHTLLLSDTAKSDSKPELEIYADDVKCQHGATVGQLNKDSLGYMRARGIDIEIAKKMLREAFGAVIIEAIKLPELKKHIEKLRSSY